jgi:hypothetical protein
MKREESRILAVSAILAVSVARVIWRDSLAKIADTKIIGIDTQWDIWYNLSSVILSLVSGNYHEDFGSVVMEMA